MAYRKDEDLEFLREMKDEDLSDLVSILAYDKDGETRWSESLTNNELYKKFNPQHQKYLDLILEEFQRFGGHSFANLARGGGVLYKEILCDVCDKCEVNYNKNSTTTTIEQNLFMKILEDSMQKMSADELKELAKDFDLGLSSYTKDAIMTGLQIAIKKGGFYSYQLALIVANAVAKAILGRGLSIAANATLTRTISAFVGPIGWAITGLWTLSDLAGPAYRVTIPAVIEIAFLRQEKERREEEERKRIQEQEEALKSGKKLSIEELFNQKTNILIVGGTGVGKSSTINALFQREGGGEVAEVGNSSKPQTMEIKKYKLDTFTIWDSPGLGDSTEKDEEHSQKIIKLLQEKDDKNEALIDLVLVIIEASSRDLGTTYKLINEVIIPHLEDKKRILIAMNKCDLVSPRDFDYEKNKPNESLINKLDENAKIIQERIKKDTDVDVEVIYYCAGEKEHKQAPYNLSKLLYYIVKHTPKRKRLIYAKHQNENEVNFISNDGLKDYKRGIIESWLETIKEFVNKGFEKGKELVDYLSKPEVQRRIKAISNIGKEIFYWCEKITKKMPKK